MVLCGEPCQRQDHLFKFFLSQVSTPPISYVSPPKYTMFSPKYPIYPDLRGFSRLYLGYLRGYLGYLDIWVVHWSLGYFEW